MSDELEPEIPISAGARSTEENALAIYIYCPELLYENPIDANLFAYPPHKQLFEAIMCGLEGRSWNKAAFSKNISQRTLERARKELIDTGKIRYENSCKGKGKGNKYVYYLTKEGAKKDDSSSREN